MNPPLSGSLKTINLKLFKANNNSFLTPKAPSTLNQRKQFLFFDKLNNKIPSHSFKQRAKIQIRSASRENNSNQKDKAQTHIFIKLKKKASEILKTQSTQQNTYIMNSVNNSNHLQSKKTSIESIQTQIFDFQQNQFLQKIGIEKDKDWDKLIEEKKRQLYSNLYNLDKKLYALEENDIFSEGNLRKKDMMQLIKKKCGNKRVDLSGQRKFHQISINRYKTKIKK